MGILEDMGGIFGHNEAPKSAEEIRGVTGLKRPEGIEVGEATPEQLAEAERKLTQEMAGKMKPEDIRWDIDKAA